jgi:Papain family cysteine protease
MFSMKFIFIYLLLTSFAQGREDHSALWSGVRNQKSIGSCHAFASTAMVEALYSEVHGQNIDLSEADVFAKYVFGETLSLAEESVKRRIRSAISFNLSEIDSDQGGYIDDDINLMKKSGIKSELDSPYDRLLKLFKDMRSTADSRSAEKNPALAVEKFVSIHQQELSTFYQSGAETESVKDLLSRFKIYRIPLDHDQEGNKALILSYLSCRPVGISISPRALGSNEDGSHAVVLRGFTEDKFLIRNSWSGKGASSGKMSKILPGISRAWVLMESNRREPQKNCP